MKLYIEIDARQGIVIGGYIGVAALRALLAAGAGLAAVPWLTQLGHGLGWL